MNHQEYLPPVLIDREGCVPADVSGRGTVYFFPFGEDGEGVLRPCRRGGLVRLFLKDHYLFVNRPLREFEVHGEAFRRGVPVPPLLGVAWCRRGIAFSGALATERLKGDDLDVWLRRSDHDAPEEERILGACGSMLRHCHDKGLFHADLNVKNIFITGTQPSLLDFDRARFYPSLGRVRRARNLLRLRRSFHRLGHGEDAYQALLKGYGGLHFPRWLRLLYSGKDLFSDMFKGKRKSS